MQTTLSQTRTESNHDSENRPYFNIVMMYEDFAAGTHAKETYDYLAHELGHDYEFTNQMWKFDVLGNSKMRELAVKDALAADLIIISTHGMGELPAEMKTWIEDWQSEKGNAKALVTLLDKPQTEGSQFSAVRNYLQGVAKKAGMNFFSQPDAWPDGDDDFSSEQISERVQLMSAVMADLIQHNPPAAHWGINE